MSISISHIVCESYKYLESPTLIGVATLIINDNLKIYDAPVLYKKGERSIGLPLKKIGYNYSPILEFISSEDMEKYKELGLKAVDEYLKKLGVE